MRLCVRVCMRTCAAFWHARGRHRHGISPSGDQRFSCVGAYHRHGSVFVIRLPEGTMAIISCCWTEVSQLLRVYPRPDCFDFFPWVVQVYSLHKSSTRAHVLKMGEQWGAPGRGQLRSGCLWRFRFRTRDRFECTRQRTGASAGSG